MEVRGTHDNGAMVNVAPVWHPSQELANEMYRTDDFMLEKFEREIGVTASDEPPRVVRDVITHECLDKVVAVVVARLHPQFERLTGVGAGG